MEYQKEKKQTKIFEAIMAENFLQVNVGHQTIDTGSSRKPRKTKQITNKTTPWHIVFTLQKNKDKLLKNLERSQRNAFTYRG